LARVETCRALKIRSSLLVVLAMIKPLLDDGEFTHDCTRATPALLSVRVYEPKAEAVTVPSTVPPLSVLPFAPGTDHLDPEA
jgi:hypothetical protein